jgi:hypothetical protein
MLTWKEFSANNKIDYKGADAEYDHEKALCNSYNFHIKQEFYSLNPQSPTYREQRAELAQILFGTSDNAKAYQDCNNKAREMGLLDKDCNMPHKEFVDKVISLRQAADKENLQDWGLALCREDLSPLISQITRLEM